MIVKFTYSNGVEIVYEGHYVIFRSDTRKVAVACKSSAHSDFTEPRRVPGSGSARGPLGGHSVL